MSMFSFTYYHQPLRDGSLQDRSNYYGHRHIPDPLGTSVLEMRSPSTDIQGSMILALPHAYYDVLTFQPSGKSESMIFSPRKA